MTIQSTDKLNIARDYLIKKLGREDGELAYAIAFHVNSRHDHGTGRVQSTIGDIAGKRAFYRQMSDKQVGYLKSLLAQHKASKQASNKWADFVESNTDEAEFLLGQDSKFFQSLKASAEKWGKLTEKQMACVRKAMPSVSALGALI